MKKVTIIIPVKNEEDNIVAAVKSIEQNKNLDIHFIVVDDNSSDNTFKNISSYFSKNHRISGIVQKNDLDTCGAGVCRNLGMKLIPKDTDYVFFFDADDIMPENALEIMVEGAERYNVDIVIGQYEYYNAKDNAIGLNQQDSRIWNCIFQNVKDDELVINPEIHQEILRTVNYPWNKLIKYEFIEKINLRFGETIVNNDILAHWQILMNAKEVLLIKTSVCQHFVISDNSQITNVFDARRMDVFKALEEVESMCRNRKFNKFRSVFVAFKNDLLAWVYDRIDENHREEFHLKRISSYSDWNFEDFISCSFYNVHVAIKAGKTKFGME
ncbi:MAG: glycosyltransferase family 2 protein [Bacteroidetes bacterium]|nr:glycosyltransferase family 2 protein [Bacteroidota bacterium]